MKRALVSLFMMELELVGLVSVSGLHTAPLFSHVIVTSMLTEKKSFEYPGSCCLHLTREQCYCLFQWKWHPKELKRYAVGCV